MKRQHPGYRSILQRGTQTILAALLTVLVCAPITPRVAAQGETRRKEPALGTRPRRATEFSHDAVKPADEVGRAVGTVCLERTRDPLGSVPIDEMQSRPSLPLKNPEVTVALRRAEQLLPKAREMAIEALYELGEEYKIEETRLQTAEARLRAVVKIEPDMDLRDNASVSTNRPTVITFGTIFLVGLPSNEGMIAVLSHELTHLGDGKDDTLAPLFQKIGRRAALSTGMRISGRRSEELTCDLIGTMVSRSLIARTPNREPLPRRLSRALGHNCVDRDDTDEAHLSPRSTMRALLALDKILADTILGKSDAALLPSDWLRLSPRESQANQEAFLFAGERCKASL
jgi:hypothetical protein